MWFKKKIHELVFKDEQENEKDFLIEYYLIKEHREDLYFHTDIVFGILLEKRCKNSEIIEISSVLNISPDKSRILELIDWIVQHSVTTTGLEETIHAML